MAPVCWQNPSPELWTMIASSFRGTGSNSSIDSSSGVKVPYVTKLYFKLSCKPTLCDFTSDFPKQDLRLDQDLYRILGDLTWTSPKDLEPSL